MLPLVAFSIVRDAPGVDGVAEQFVEVAAAEGLAAVHSPIRAAAGFGSEAELVGLLLDSPHGAQLEIEPKERAYGLRLDLEDGERATVGLVAERYGASHPQPLALRGGDLVTNAFPRDLPLELSEREEHVQSKASHRGRRVELLGHGHERDSVRVHHLDDLREVGERAGQTIDLVDDDCVDLLGIDIGQ
jgi:hypothetical protein